MTPVLRFPGFYYIDLSLMNKTTVLLTLWAVAALTAAQAGDITGTITLKGTPPAEKSITPLKEDPTCGKLHSDTPTTRFYVTGANGALADVVVYLEGISGKSAGASAAAVTMDQKGCEYIPQILAVQTGQKLVVKNSDPVLHNIHVSPAPDAGNKEDNKAQMPGGADLSFSFDKPELFLKFKCDVHPWMFAWVSVFDHPYYSVSGKDGTFKIANVPAGKYTLVAQHRKAGTVKQEIEVKDGEAAKADLSLEAK
jgi:plastocyanin